MQNLRYSPYLKSIFSILDALVMCGTIAYFNDRTSVVGESNLFTMLLLLFFWFLLSSKTKIYNIPRILTYTSYLERLLLHLLFFNFGAILISKITKADDLVFGTPKVLTYFSVIVFIVKSLIFAAVKWGRLKGYNYRNIMFLSDSGASSLLREVLSKRKDYGYRIFDYHQPVDLKNLRKFWSEQSIHTIYIPLVHPYPQDLINDIIREAENHKVRVSVIPDMLTDRFTDFHISYAESQPILEKSKQPLEFLGNFALKRAFDIAFSLAFLIFIASWLFPVIALLIKLDGKGPVFFSQKRYGFRDQEFSCLKFRTMVDNPECTVKTTEKNDRRITKIGNFLRKSSLDETPQFLNVLLGDMSVVGPRPHMVAVDDHYKTFIERYALRFLVRPGITGLAQISGLRGENGDMNVQMQKRILADAFYVKNWSLGLDVIIIVKTLYILIKGDKKAF